jgi:site-specific DNA recombinase
MTKEEPKRVWALYRVSTKSQVSNIEDGGDIPVQENACRKFVSKQDGWKLTNEIYEKGISGWKKSTDERDALVKIKEGALNDAFDILLVFLFDRIGRREDESPLVLQFLIENGIEVWSTKEGQAKLEQHSDLLINYIRFWQSSGESKKTSIRVTEALSQMNEQGDWTGGTVPFGYVLYETDKPHPKKQRNIKILTINKEESPIVELIFDLTLNKGFGASRITKHLNDNGYTNRDNKIWRHNTISRMLRNTIYMGRRRYNVIDKENHINSMIEWKLQPLKEELVIIPEDKFMKVQELIDSRKTVKGENVDSTTSSKLLLAGIATCGYCGHKLKADYTIKKYKRKSDGIVTKTYQPRYRCHYGNNTSSHGKQNFGAKMYEEQVENIVINVISKINMESFLEKANKYKHDNVYQKVIQLNKLKDHVQVKQRQLEKLNEEIIKVIMGESKFTEERLNTAIDMTENEMKSTKEQIEIIKKEIDNSKIEMSDIDYLKTEFKDWESKYRNADISSKKMMLSRIIKDIQFKDKEINISFKLNIENSSDIIVDNHPHSNSTRGTSTLQELLLKHLERQGLRNIEFEIGSNIA